MLKDEITQIIRETVARLKAKGKYTGIAAGGNTEEVLGHRASFWTEMLCAGADFDFIRDGAVNNRKMLEKVHKNK